MRVWPTVVFVHMLLEGVSFGADYFNSAESMCSGNDPTILMCDDFEDGTWVAHNCNYVGLEDDGWCAVTTYLNSQSGDVGFNPPNVPGYAVCGNRGAAGTSCSATSSIRYNGPPHTNEMLNFSHGMMAEHAFVNASVVTELYVRWYLKLLPGYTPGHEKVMTHRDKGDGNGNCCTVFLNYDDTNGQHELVMHYGPGGAGTQHAFPNQTNALPSPLPLDRWFYIEAHYNLNNPGQSNGVYELWADDCGANGLDCTGPGTLRARHTNLVYRTSETGDFSTLGNLWIENYANAPTTGESLYDQVVAATRRIGPMRASIGHIPAPPQNLVVR